MLWQSDFTYLETAEGWLFLAFTLDACTRRCVAHHCRPDMRGELTTTTLALAVQRQPPPPGLLHHSDRGVQYAAAAFAQLAAARGITLSMSRNANPYDNALAESFVATLKTECFGDAIPPTRAAAQAHGFRLHRDLLQPPPPSQQPRLPITARLRKTNVPPKQKPLTSTTYQQPKPFYRRKISAQLKAFLLRNGYRYTGKSAWTEAHRRYLRELVLPHAAQRVVLEDAIAAIAAAGERIARLEDQMHALLESWAMKPVVEAVMGMRGFALVGAMVLVSELGGAWRFDHPRQLMAYLGLVPTENTSDQKRRQGGITKTGNSHARWLLIEAAQHYRLSSQGKQGTQRPAARAKSGDQSLRLESADPAAQAHDAVTAPAANSATKSPWPWPAS